MAQVITEDDIFKYLIPREDEDIDVLNNMRSFLSNVSVNIFKDEYYILYKAIEIGNKYRMKITLDHLEQLVLTNLDDLLKDKNVTMYQGGDEDYTENERANLIQQSVSSTYQMLKEFDITDEHTLHALRFNVNLYVESWADEEYSKSLIASDNILREGKKYNGRLLKGREDAFAYFQKKNDMIKSLVDGDVDRLSDVIDTSVDTKKEIEEKMKEDSYEVVAKTGVDEWDKHYPLSRGEMIVIQGGSGAGKSRQGVNVCHESVVDFGKNALILSLEQKSSRVYPMMLSKHSTRVGGQSEWIADKAIIQGTLDEHQKIFKNLVEDDFLTNEEYGHVRIEGVNLHANSVRSYLNKVWDDGFHFDVVMLDYIGILDTGGGERYELITEAVNQLKAECKTFKGQGFLGVLPNQLTNKAEEALKNGDYDKSGTGGSESAYIRRGADYVYTIYQSDEMQMANKMQWLLEKVRLGDPIVSRLYILAFQGQCLYLSDELEEEEDDELM